MNIDVVVSDEMIEKILREQIRNKVDKYIQNLDNPYYMWDLFQQTIREEVNKLATKEVVQETIKEINRDVIVEKVTSRVTEQIANVFANLDY